MSKLFDLNWRGDEVVKLTEEQAMAIMGEFGLTAEGESKKDLKKGRGVKSGTLRRSIHAESPQYNYAGDNVEPSSGSPERGGKLVKAVRDGSHRFVVALGSGLVYAMKIHQGWGSFLGYHYITNGVDKTKAKLGAIIGRHQVK